MALQPGQTFGAYEIVAAIGHGGMGEVYRARDWKLQRDVALKVLPDAFASDPERLARFQREAEVLASLSHPNIGTIHGVEEAAGLKALVLELIDGPTLADRIAQGPVPLDEALLIARQIADALECAHERGIVHRDLKPSNIKIRDDGAVKVLDFGLAKLAERSDSANRPSDFSQSPTITSPAMATYAGVILGTAAYMSPEQAKGKPVDKRTDIWAFGCVLFEMLTGTRPFDGEDVTDVLAAIVRGEPDWTALPEDVPEHIRLLMRRCLEKDRGKRISDIGVARFLIVEPVAAGAMRVAPADAPSALKPRPLWRRALPALASAIVASALVGAAVWQFRPASPQTVTRFTYRLGDGQQFTNTGRHSVAISPDGTQMAYVANLRLYLKSSWEVEATPIAGTGAAQVTTPVFSPDGRSIAFFSAPGSGGGALGTLKKIATNGGAPVTLCQASNPFGMSWDGDSILFGQAGRGVLRVSANGGTPEVLAGVKDTEVAHGPQMLPGGRSLLYTLASGTDWDNAQIVVQTPGSSERKTVIKGGSDARYLPTGHIVYALGGVMFAVPFDVRRLETVGGPVPIVEGVRRALLTAASQFAVSRTGSLIYIPGPAATASAQLDLALLDRKGTVARLKLPPRDYQFPRVSPNGRQVAVGIDDGKEAAVWIYDLAGTSSIRRLTFGGNNRFPTWTSDSTRIAFQSDRDGDPAIFFQRADGTGTAERITRPDKGQTHIPHAWSPSGDSMLFSVGNGSDQSLWTFSLPDKKAAAIDAVRSSTLLNAALSPDGRWVAYTSTETEATTVFVQPFPATGAKYQIATGVNPFWAPSGTELFFATTQGAGFAVVSVQTEPTFTFGNPTTVPRPGTVVRTGTRNYDILPDGNRFVIVVDGSDTAGDAGSAPQINVVLNWFEELKARVPTR